MAMLYSRRLKDKTKKMVQPLRKYRIGELPDIQINYKDIIQPLLTVTEMDKEIAG